MPFKRTTGKADSPYIQKPCVISIDQSYARTGMAICVNGKIKKITSIDFKNVKTKTAKRLLLQERLISAIESCLKKYGPEDIAIVCERIRTFTQGDGIRPDVLKSHGALVAYIVDTGFKFGIETWSADTRAWKSAVLGTSKPSFEPINGVKNPQKFGSVRKIIKLGLDEEIRKYKRNHSEYSYDDDAADAGCISLYAFTSRPKLKKEI